jgi:hypothetical protein
LPFMGSLALGTLVILLLWWGGLSQGVGRNHPYGCSWIAVKRVVFEESAPIRRTIRTVRDFLIEE